MSRSWRILFALLFILSLSFASTYIYFPVSGEVSDGGTFYIGKVGPNHTVRLILDASLPSPIISVSTSPESDVILRDGRAWITFTAPSSPGRYHIAITVERNTGIESFNVAYDVERNLLTVELPSDTVSIPEAGSSSFDVGIINRSVGETVVRISCGFCDPVERPLPPKEAVKITLRASAELSGVYDDVLTIEDLLSGEKYKLPLKVVVNPTMEGRVKTVYHFPDLFFPILYPFRIILGVIFWKM